MSTFERQLAAVLQLLTEGQYKFKSWRGSFIVEVNPLGSKFLGLARMEARGFTDQKGNVYMWAAKDAEHLEVVDMINEELAVTSPSPNRQMVEIAVPFTVTLKPRTEEVSVSFSKWTDGLVPSDKYEATLRKTPNFMRLLKGVKYDPFVKEKAYSFGLSNPFGEVYDDDDDFDNTY